MNEFRDVFDGQKEYFATGVTRSYDWRVDQIDRVRQMVAGNEAALQAAMPAILRRRSEEIVFETLAEVREAEFQKSQLREWMKPVEAPVRAFSRRDRTQGGGVPRALRGCVDRRALPASIRVTNGPDPTLVCDTCFAPVVAMSSTSFEAERGSPRFVSPTRSEIQRRTLLQRG